MSTKDEDIAITRAYCEPSRRVPYLRRALGIRRPLPGLFPCREVRP
jgi:hypothetical protein